MQLSIVEVFYFTLFVEEKASFIINKEIKGARNYWRIFRYLSCALSSTH